MLNPIYAFDSKKSSKEELCTKGYQLTIKDNLGITPLVENKHFIVSKEFNRKAVKGCFLDPKKDEAKTTRKIELPDGRYIHITLESVFHSS